MAVHVKGTVIFVEPGPKRGETNIHHLPVDTEIAGVAKEDSIPENSFRTFQLGRDSSQSILLFNRENGLSWHRNYFGLEFTIDEQPNRHAIDSIEGTGHTLHAWRVENGITLGDITASWSPQGRELEIPIN